MGRHLIVKKPAAPAFSIKPLPLGFVVVDQAGNYVSRVFPSEASATGAMTRARRAASRTVRPCLCCTKEFSSEGAHNRLCDTCRRGENLSPYRYILPRGK